MEDVAALISGAVHTLVYGTHLFFRNNPRNLCHLPVFPPIFKKFLDHFCYTLEAHTLRYTLFDMEFNCFYCLTGFRIRSAAITWRPKTLIFPTKRAALSSFPFRLQMKFFQNSKPYARRFESKSYITYPLLQSLF